MTTLPSIPTGSVTRPVKVSPCLLLQVARVLCSLIFMAVPAGSERLVSADAAAGRNNSRTGRGTTFDTAFGASAGVAENTIEGAAEGQRVFIRYNSCSTSYE